MRYICNDSDYGNHGNILQALKCFLVLYFWLKVHKKDRHYGGVPVLITSEISLP